MACKLTSETRAWLADSAQLQTTANFLFGHADANKNGTLEQGEAVELVRTLFRNSGHPGPY